MNDMIPTAPEQFIDLALLAPKLGFARTDHLVRLFNRLVRDGIIGIDEFSSDKGETSKLGGRPRVITYVSLSGAMALAAHARTIEAAIWRKEQLGRLARPADEPALVNIEALADAVAERVFARFPRRQRLPKPSAQLTLTLAPRLEGDMGRIVAWLDQLPKGTEISIDSIADALGIEMSPGLGKRIGVMLRRSAWKQIGRIKVAGGQRRFYRKA